MTVLGDAAFKEVTELKEVLKAGPRPADWRPPQKWGGSGDAPAHKQGRGPVRR